MITLEKSLHGGSRQLGRYTSIEVDTDEGEPRVF